MINLGNNDQQEIPGPKIPEGFTLENEDAEFVSCVDDSVYFRTDKYDKSTKQINQIL